MTDDERERRRFERTDEELVLLERAQGISCQYPRPTGRAFDAAELRRIFRKLAPTGYLGSTLPKEAGGHGLNALQFSALCEGLAPRLTLLGNHSVQRYLHEFGTPRQQKRFMPSLLDGESIGAISMTEQHAGSDLERMTTSAYRSGHSYLITGEKTWVTHGMVADLIVVLARTDTGFTRFLVPGDAPGMTREPLEPVGLKHLGFARLTFLNCEVPIENRLGEEGAGLEGAKAAFPIARILAALQLVRIARTAVAIVRMYVEDRVVSGFPLASSTYVRQELARLTGRSDSIRLLSLRVASDVKAPDAVANASSAKALAGELAMDACRYAEDLLGSTSLQVSHPLIQLVADARMMAVVDGTSMLNHLVVGRRIFPSVKGTS